MRRLLPLAFLLIVPIAFSACGGGGGGSQATVSQDVPATGGTVSLGDEVTLVIPDGALTDATTVTITKATDEEKPPSDLEAADSLGSAYDIDLGGQTLAKPVTLEVVYDPEKVTEEEAAQPFLAFFDEEKDTWIPVGGSVDPERRVIVYETDHLSWWSSFTRNWGAWRVLLDSVLTLNVTNFLRSVALIAQGCSPGGTTVTVDKSRARDVIQGCVDRDSEQPQLRVVNPRSFFIEVSAVSGGNGYPERKILSPGEQLTFDANTADPAPLIVAGETTQRAGKYLLVHLVIQMLPGLNQLGIQGAQIACITERLHDVAYFASAVEALIVNHDGAAAAEGIINFLRDPAAVRRFITASDDCFYGSARTWSVEGFRQVGAASATIYTTFDFVKTFLSDARPEVAFNWTQRATATPPPTCSFGDARLCELVKGINDGLESGNYDVLLAHMTFEDQTCGPVRDPVMLIAPLVARVWSCQDAIPDYRTSCPDLSDRQAAVPETCVVKTTFVWMCACRTSNANSRYLTAEQYVQHILPDAVVYAVAKDSQGKPLVLLRARSVSLPGEYGWGDMPDTWALSIDPATLAITGTYAYLPVPDGFFDHDIATPWPELLPSQAPPSQSLSKTFDGSCISFKYPESWSVWFDDVRNEGPYWQELTIVANLTQSADGGAERQFVPGEIKIDIMARELRSSEHDMARSGEPHPIVIDGRALTAYLHDDPVWGPSVGVAVDVGNLRYSAGAGLGSRDDLPAALSVMRTLKLKCDMSPG